MGRYERKKRLLKTEIAEYKSDISQRVGFFRKYGPPAAAIGGGLFLLYIAGRKIWVKQHAHKSPIWTLFHRRPVRRSWQSEFSRKILLLIPGLVFAIVRAGLVRYIRKPVKVYAAPTTTPG